LGERQWEWLDEALARRRTDVKFTLICAGIQILPDRFLVETFNWPNKEKLFALIRKYKLQHFLLVSGDVHFAQTYKEECPSLTGINNVWEVTASGLSHTQEHNVPFAAKNMNLFTPLYSQEPA
jgi:hypothetical protein